MTYYWQQTEKYRQEKEEKLKEIKKNRYGGKVKLKKKMYKNEGFKKRNRKCCEREREEEGRGEGGGGGSA